MSRDTGICEWEVIFSPNLPSFLALKKEILCRTTETLTTVFSIRRSSRVTYCPFFHLSLLAIVVYTLIILIFIYIVEMNESGVASIR